MKYTVNMTKTEMKNLSNSFAALSKTVLNAILPQISEDYAEVLSKADISFNDFVDKLTSGGMSNKDFTIEYIVHKDTITVNVEMDIKLMLKVLSFYKKFMADVIPYIVAFCKKHEDELGDLSELLSSRAEAMTEALMEMIEDFDMDADTALYLTKQIFGRIIDHYEEQEKMSKEEELERKYHKKNTEE